MKAHTTIKAEDLTKFARFLEEHPGFSPELMGDTALVCGFHLGKCFLTIEEMDMLIATQPLFNLGATALLCAKSG